MGESRSGTKEWAGCLGLDTSPHLHYVMQYSGAVKFGVE